MSTIKNTPKEDTVSEHPPDFVPDPDVEDEHTKETVGGPGGVVNYPRDTWPDGFDPDSPDASPKVGA